jgi:type I restriction enzyme S subunit
METKATTPILHSRPDLPTGWRWVRLGNHVHKVGSGITPTGGQAAYVPHGIPLIRSQNVHMNRFVYDGLAFITARHDAEMEGSRVESNDVLLNITGASIGRVCVIPHDLCPANVNQHVSIIRLDGTLSPQFVAYYISSPAFQKFIAISQAGATRQALTKALIENFRIPAPPLAEQQRIAALLQDQMTAVERARAAAETRLEAIDALMISHIRQSINSRTARRVSLGDCLIEIRDGVGPDWSRYRLIGATREGIAPAKESVGKNPERYKLVDPGTVFYNPMRIIIGSIAMVDEGDPPGITSPDYVVIKGKPGVLDSRWFYRWFRSPYGNNLIDSMSRGAVRERILFKRLAAGEIELPSFAEQKSVSSKLKKLAHLRMMSLEESAVVSSLPVALLRRAFLGAL